MGYWDRDSLGSTSRTRYAACFSGVSVIVRGRLFRLIVPKPLLRCIRNFGREVGSVGEMRFSLIRINAPARGTGTIKTLWRQAYRGSQQLTARF